MQNSAQIQNINMKYFLLRALVKDGASIGAQRLLVDPVTLSLGLVRSLSIWNHDIPEIEVKGSLKSVKVRISVRFHYYFIVIS